MINEGGISQGHTYSYAHVMCMYLYIIEDNKPVLMLTLCTV